MRVESVEPVDLRAGKLVHQHRRRVDGGHRQRAEAQPAAVLVLAQVHTFQFVLDADADFVRLVDARFVGDGHARSEHHGVVGAQALGAFVHARDEAHPVAGAAAVVDLVRPQRRPGKGVQRKAGAVIEEHRAGHVDVALQHPGVEAALAVGQRAHGIGAGDVGGAAVVLAAVVHQQEAPRLDAAVHLAFGVVVHHGGVGAPGRDGGEAVLKIAGLFGAAALEHRLDVGLVEGAAFGQGLFQIHLEPHQRHAVPDVAFPDVLQFHLVLHALERKDRVGPRHGGVGGQRRIQVVVGGLLVHQEHFPGADGAHRVHQFAVAPHGHAAGGQHGGVGGVQAAVRQEQRAGVPRDQREGHRQRRVGDVPRAQVQQPAHAVQPGHGQRRGPGLCQFGAHQFDALGRRGPGLGGGQQAAGGVGQGGAFAGGVPDGPGHVAALQRRAVFGQGFGILAGAGGGHAAAVQQQGLARPQAGGQVVRHRGHPGGTVVHTFDPGAGQLFVGLDIEAAVAPQRRAFAGDDEGRVLPGKAGEPGQGVVVVGQVFAAMGVAGGQQHGVAPGGFGGRAQGGDLFADGQGGTLLFLCRVGAQGGCARVCRTFL